MIIHTHFVVVQYILSTALILITKVYHHHHHCCDRVKQVKQILFMDLKSMNIQCILNIKREY